MQFSSPPSRLRFSSLISTSTAKKPSPHPPLKLGYRSFYQLRFCNCPNRKKRLVPHWDGLLHQPAPWSSVTSSV